MKFASYATVYNVIQEIVDTHTLYQRTTPLLQEQQTRLDKLAFPGNTEELLEATELKSRQDALLSERAAWRDGIRNQISCFEQFCDTAGITGITVDYNNIPTRFSVRNNVLRGTGQGTDQIVVDYPLS